MANTYYAVYEHIAFSTKARVAALSDAIRPDLFAYLAGTLKNQGCFPLIIGGLSEHVHLLIRKRGTLLTSDLVKEIKRSSSIWLKKHGAACGKFSWQVGYGAFSVSYWDLEKIRVYIANQEEHHRHMTWEEEYRKLLKKHGVEFDERYFLD